MKATIRFLALVLFMLLANSFVFAQDTTLTVTSDGKVGIGTTGPGAKLHVVHDVDTWGGILVGEVGVNNERFHINHYGGPGSGTQIIQEGNLPLRFVTNGSERVRISGNGNVGIGTTNPAPPMN